MAEIKRNQRINKIIDDYLKSGDKNKETIKELERGIKEGETKLNQLMDEASDKSHGKKYRKEKNEEVLSWMKFLGQENEKLDELKSKEASRSKVENLQELRNEEIEIIKRKNKELKKLSIWEQAESNNKKFNEKIQELEQEYRDMDQRRIEVIKELKVAGLSDEDKRSKEEELKQIDKKMVENQDEQSKQRERQSDIDDNDKKILDSLKDKNPDDIKRKIATLRKDLEKYAQRLNKVEASMYWLITGKTKDSEGLKERLANWDSSDRQRGNTIRAITGTDEEEYERTMGLEPIDEAREEAQETAELPAKQTKIDRVIARLEEKHPKIAAVLQKTVNTFRKVTKRNGTAEQQIQQEEAEELEQTTPLSNITVDLEEQKENLMIALVAEHGYKEGIKKYQEQIKEQTTQERTAEPKVEEHSEHTR